MLVKTKGIVLNSIKFQETSLIVKIYTQDYGLISFIVKGVRSAKAKGKAALFQSGLILDLVVYMKPAKKLQQLRDFSLHYTYKSVFEDVRKSSILIFVIECLHNALLDETEDKALFKYIERALMTFDQQEFDPNFHLHFLLDFLKYYGIAPNANQLDQQVYFDLKNGNFIQATTNYQNQQDAKSAQLFYKFLVLGINPSNSHDRKAILNIVLQYIQYHLEHFKPLKSLTVLETILK